MSLQIETQTQKPGYTSSAPKSYLNVNVSNAIPPAPVPSGETVDIYNGRPTRQERERDREK